MREYKAPDLLPYESWRKSLFLAGSIEMGVAEDWQAKLVQNLSDLDIDILNPRRHGWDSAWVQSIDNPQFVEQVEWELDAMEYADVIALVLLRDTKSPISLLELGIHHKSKKLVVYCPEGFWRKGNVDVVCERYKIPQVNSFEDLTEALKRGFECK